MVDDGLMGPIVDMAKTKETLSCGLARVVAVRLSSWGSRYSPSDELTLWVMGLKDAVSDVLVLEIIPLPCGCSTFYFTFDRLPFPVLLVFE